MTDEIANLVLEHFKRFQSDMSFVREDMHLMRMEMTTMRHDLASVRTLQDVQSAETATPRARLDRVEARLDLRDN